MSNVDAAPLEPPAPSDPGITVVDAPQDTPDKISISDAARRLQSARKPKQKEAPVEAEAPEPVSSASEEADASPAPAPSETEVQPDSVELPPVDAPRSWSKDDKETFASLPRETQERIAERERSRETDFLRRQNEAAEIKKGLEAQMQAAEAQRQQYEAALPVLLENLQSQQSGQFSDIKTMGDVQRMASEDPLRYTQWDAWQKQASAIQMEIQNTQQRNQNEQAQQWQSFAQKEDARFAENVPDIADPEKGVKLRQQAFSYLKTVGYNDDEIAQAWNSPQWRDHRSQEIILDAARYRKAVAEKKAAVPVKPLPQVQRPGAATGKNAELEQRHKALEQKLEKSGNPKDAAKLLMERRAARR